MDCLIRIAEQKIEEAMIRGDFENLSLKGKPLKIDLLSEVPGELRLAFSVLRNAGLLPPEMELRREIVTLRDLIRACTKSECRGDLERKLQDRMLRYNVLMGK
ncbi:MAG: DUF1992 domain-containing protein [Acidobacteria bacterium]|nr:DUF1992 domain-containing protein [Acidobacteriota bacterium]